MKRRYVVGKLRPPAPLALPKGRFVGRTFIDTDGVEMESTWDGKGKLPRAKDWPEGNQSTSRTIGHPVVTP